MPHYYLHIRNREGRLDDPEGAEYADLATAKVEAIEGARQLISECVRNGTPLGLYRAFEIVDSNEQILATVRFSEAVVTD
jgi:hypothetical protein